MTAIPGVLSKAHRLLAPRVAFLIGTRSGDGEPNLIPVSNVTSVSTAPEQVMIAVYKRWKTFENLASAAGFTVCLPHSIQLDGVWKLGARYSGYSVSDRRTKLKTCGLAIDETASTYGPVLADGLGWLACGVVERLDFGGDHGVVVGAVEEVRFDPAAFDPDGTPRVDVRPVMQITGNRFTTADASTTADYLG